MKISNLSRAFGTIAAAVALAGVAQPAAAQSAGAQYAALVRENPGSSLVYGGCRAVAESEYRNTGSADSALGVLTVCAGLGCAFTDSASNCLSVVSQLFFLEPRLR